MLILLDYPDPDPDRDERRVIGVAMAGAPPKGTVVTLPGSDLEYEVGQVRLNVTGRGTDFSGAFTAVLHEYRTGPTTLEM